MPTEAHDRDVDPLALIVDRDQDTRALYTDFLEFHRWRDRRGRRAGGPDSTA